MNRSKDPTLIHLEEWFNSAQDRAQQWFTTHTRIITVIAAFIAAFVLQLDTFEVFQRISSDADLRAKLLAHADALQKNAEAVFRNSDLGDQKEHQAIVAQLREIHPDVGNSLDQRPNITTLNELDKWLSEKLGTIKNAAEIIADYKQLLFKQKLGAAGESFDKVNDEFKKTGFDLLPKPYPNVRSKDWSWLRFWRFSGDWSWPPRHLLGILVSAGLLSLGAPFWFNTLKSLTNLRPKLAEEIDKDPKQIPRSTP